MRPDRPGRPDRPDWSDRPDRPDRPIIGSGNNNNNNYVNIENNRWVNNNRWNSWNRPNRHGNWGWDGYHNNHWHDHWQNHHVHHHHHDWYHGAWHGHWGNNWYAPAIWGSIGWGLGSWYSGNYFGGAYYNPYCEPVAAIVAPYDYSQPVVVTNYVYEDYGTTVAALPPVEETAQAAALSTFDVGLASFKSGDYRGALAQFDDALKQFPGDPVVHEVRALTLFALKDYQPAAAALNSLLATAPGMDWTTMAGLYSNVDDYTLQLRTLEAHLKLHPDDPAGNFVLAYHYLVTGHPDAAASALRVVVREQPKDVVAKKMLDSLVATDAPEAVPAPADPPVPAPLDRTIPPVPPVASGGSATDLVGSWRATAGDTTIELTVDDEFGFVWKATPKDKPAVELTGQLEASNEKLVLNSKTQGAMEGNVTSQGPDKFQFSLSGEGEKDDSLTFERVR